MVPKKIIATLGIVLLFGIGIAAAALADVPPPTTTDPTTSTPTSTTAATTSTTISTATTTTSAETTTTTVPTTTTTTAAPSPPRSATSTRGLPQVVNMSDAPFAIVRSVRPHRKKRRHRASKPLEVTPPLGQDSYVFPVVGPSGYGDSYGAFRGDVSGKWHHGDDLFAPLGTPVVAVANGTIFGIGWERIGGWRLWVQDAAANEFYYAHLSGYAPSDFHSDRVRAGEVIGFVGNTGDAFPRAPHLHFEVHPHQLLRLGYDGAVDPTTYLDGWVHLRSVHTPFPFHPRLPTQPFLRREARYDFGELLAARHLTNRPPAPIERPVIDLREGLRVASMPQLLPAPEEPAMPRVAAATSMRTIPLLAGLLVIALFATTIVLATRVVLVCLWR